MNKSKRVPASQTHQEMVAQWKTDPAFKAEYDALEEEYQLLHDMVLARKRSGLKQSEVAEQNKIYSITINAYTLIAYIYILYTISVTIWIIITPYIYM